MKKLENCDASWLVKALYDGMGYWLNGSHMTKGSLGSK